MNLFPAESIGVTGVICGFANDISAFFCISAVRPIGAEHRQAEGEGMVVRVKIQRCKVMLGSVGVSLLRNVFRSFHYFKF